MSKHSVDSYETSFIPSNDQKKKKSGSARWIRHNTDFCLIFQSNAAEAVTDKQKYQTTIAADSQTNASTIKDLIMDAMV